MPEVSTSNNRRRIVRPALLDPTSLEARVLDETESCYQIAESYYGREFSRPDVVFDLEGKSGGMYVWYRKTERHLLRYNRILLHQEKDDFIGQVVAHEVSHHICLILHGPKVGHGPEWQAIMVDVFHKVADRCHDYDVTATMREAFVYACECGYKYPMSKVRHSRALQGSSYSCPQCRGKLRFLYHHDPKNPKKTTYSSGNNTIPGLFLALDPGWNNAVEFEARLKAVLGGARPVRVFTLNDPYGHEVLSAWLIRLELTATGPLTADGMFGRSGPSHEVTHAVGFTASQTSEVARNIQHLAAQGVKTRLLRI